MHPRHSSEVAPAGTPMTSLWPILTSPDLSSQRLSMQFSHLLEVCSSFGFQGTVASCFSSCFTGHCLSTSFTGHPPVPPPISPPSKLRSVPGLVLFWIRTHSMVVLMDLNTIYYISRRLLNLFCHPRLLPSTPSTHI